MAVYGNANCASLGLPVACNDDSGGGGGDADDPDLCMQNGGPPYESAVSVPVVQGVNYMIRVGRFSPTTSVGEDILNVQCQPAATGGCCRPDHTCVSGSTQASCQAQGGTFFVNQSCGLNQACCQSNGVCTFLPLLCCEAAGGVPQGPGSTCGASTACCMGGGACANLTSTCCVNQGGVPSGPQLCEGDIDIDGVDGRCGDLCPTDPLKTVPGQCGCGFVDVDTDSDGVADCNDNCPDVMNADQADSNQNGRGDSCDQEPKCDLDCSDDCAPRTVDGDPVHLFSGEFHVTVTDLHIPGRGEVDFSLSRTYRSRSDAQTILGNNWFMSYDLYLQVGGGHATLFDGTGRTDRFALQDGTMTRPESFRVIQPGPNNTYVMTRANLSVWTFAHVPGTPAGRYSIVSMKDRNNNEITFEYDGLGRLWKVRDTLNQPNLDNRVIVFAYNAQGRLESVTDWTGRQVRYAYYSNGETGGSTGDLKSVTLPAILNTADFPIPPGHEFPAGNQWTYTYTTQPADNRLRHNLETIRDPRGNVYLRNFYAVTVDPANLTFDRLIAQEHGSGRWDFVYKSLNPNDPANEGAILKVFVNDRAGNVKERRFDAANRLIKSIEYTGRAPNPAGPTDLDLGINVPQNPLRSTDPPSYTVSRFAYNADSLVTMAMIANGSHTEKIFDTNNSNRLMQGNRTSSKRFAGPPGADQSFLLEEWEYEGGGGCCGANFVKSYTDPRGHKTTYDRDTAGNLVLTTYPTVTLGVFGGGSQVSSESRPLYNAHGQLLILIHPSNGTNQRVDTFSYYGPEAGHMMGYLKSQTIDAGGFALTTTYAYDRVGNLTSVTDPGGHTTHRVYDQLNRLILDRRPEVALSGGTVRYETERFYDANGNLVRVEVKNFDDQGVNPAANTHFTTIHEYDILNDRIRTCQESGSFNVPIDKRDCAGLPQEEFITVEMQYDANKNLTLIRHGEAVEGRQPTNVTRLLYDERDMMFRVIRAEGDAAQSTTQYDYDAAGNLVFERRGLESIPRISEWQYDGYNRVRRFIDPMGNVTESKYDPNSNLGGEVDPRFQPNVLHPFAMEVQGELVDIPGGVGNRPLSRVMYRYDERGRRIQVDQAFFKIENNSEVAIGDGFRTIRTFYYPNSQVQRVEDDHGHGTDTLYDTAGRVQRTIDAKGNIIAYEKPDGTSGYNADSHVISIKEIEQSDLDGHPDEVFYTQIEYDSLNRHIKSVDNVGSTMQFKYDSRDNKTMYIDALGNTIQHEYDGLGRLLSTTRILTDNGLGSGHPLPEPHGVITTRQSWDDNSRLMALIDDNNHATRYGYDALGRLVARQMADGTIHQIGSGVLWPLGQVRPDLTGFTSGYDVHDNSIISVDANGSAVLKEYDRLNRPTSTSIAPGPNVAQDTTFEQYQYDGLSRPVSAQDNDTLMTRRYDSHGNVLEEVQQLTINGASSQGIVRSTYDARGNQTSCTYPGGRIITTTYDDLDRMKIISDQQGIIAVYNYAGPGRTVRRDYANSTRTDYIYDGISNIPNPPNDFGVRQIIRTRHAVTGVACAGDVDCPTGSACDSSGTCVIDDHTYTWDRMGNKTQRKDVRPDDGASPSPDRRLTYDYEHDSIYRLTRTIVTGLPPNPNEPPAIIRNTEYDFDGVGNRVTVTGNPDGSDALGSYALHPGLPEPADAQLNQYTSMPTAAIGYDANGNLISRHDDTLTDHGDFDLADYAFFQNCFTGEEPGLSQPCNRFNGLDDTLINLQDWTLLYSYFNGPRSRPAEIAYDYRNQMVRFDDMVAGQIHTYAYDALGRRVAKILDVTRLVGESSITRFFLNDWQEIEEQDSFGVPLATYAYGPYIDEVLNMRRGENDYYYHTDNLYAVTAITNAGGAVVERYEYHDYGAPSFYLGSGMPIDTLQSAIGNPFLCTGRRYDPETGLYDYRTRYLDPVAGRFQSRDTIGTWGDPGNLGNAYTSVENNPANAVDPMGLFKMLMSRREAVEKAHGVSGGINKACGSCRVGSETPGGPLFATSVKSAKSNSTDREMMGCYDWCDKDCASQPIGQQGHCRRMCYKYCDWGGRQSDEFPPGLLIKKIDPGKDKDKDKRCDQGGGQDHASRPWIYETCEACNAVCPGPCFMIPSGGCRCYLEHLRTDDPNDNAEVMSGSDGAGSAQGSVKYVDKASPKLHTGRMGGGGSPGANAKPSRPVDGNYHSGRCKPPWKGLNIHPCPGCGW